MAGGKGLGGGRWKGVGLGRILNNKAMQVCLFLFSSLFFAKVLLKEYLSWRKEFYQLFFWRLFYKWEKHTRTKKRKQEVRLFSGADIKYFIV